MKLRVMIIAALCALGLLCLAGCGASGQSQDNGQLNRQYMSSVNQLMDSLNGQMADFSDAVKEGEVLSLSTDLNEVSKTVDQLKDLEAPEELKQVHAKYVTGCEELQAVLKMYVELYEDIKAPVDKKFDFSTYDKRVAEVQEHYNAGVAALEEADTLAAEDEGAEGSEGSSGSTDSPSDSGKDAGKDADSSSSEGR